jgi:hypothetical protein
MTKTVTVQQAVQALQAGTLSGRAAYGAIHDIGKAGLTDAQSVVEQYLTNDDPELRYVALEVLTQHWQRPEHWNTARAFLEHDDDTHCRILGASALGSLKRNTSDPATLAVLASIVRDQQTNRNVREAAYAALCSVLHYEPQEQLRFAARGVDLERDVDWELIKSYSQAKKT